MKYALSNKDRIEATPKAQGICQCCGSDLIAKCGTQKIWHWAHKGKRNCDHWWENETQWHRDWKDNFPKEWQEVVHLSDDGEKHIADVKTPNGLVVEFQHSAISAEEKLSRETFYKNMIWVVDGLTFLTSLKDGYLGGGADECSNSSNTPLRYGPNFRQACELPV
jgi:competence CoiA-like predicted nuclease